MLKPVPKIKFVLAWQTYRVGDVIAPAATLRDWLIGAGYCVPVDNAPAKPPMVQRVRNVVNRSLGAKAA